MSGTTAQELPSALMKGFSLKRNWSLARKNIKEIIIVLVPHLAMAYRYVRAPS